MPAAEEAGETFEQPVLLIEEYARDEPEQSTDLHMASGPNCASTSFVETLGLNIPPTVLAQDDEAVE